MRKYRFKLFCAFLATACFWGSASANASARVVESANAISMEFDGTTLWQLHHNPAEGKPYVHPLSSTGGALFTDLRPKDHPWHRGLWFSWKYINGVNYWEEDRETGLSEGWTRLLSTTRTIFDSQEVRVHQELDYARGEHVSAVLNESREIVISVPDESGAYYIDWVSRFRALQHDVVLDRTPILGEPHGKKYGGYAGLSIRMNPKMRKGRFLNNELLVNGDGHGNPSEWMLYQSQSAGSLLFMDHPDNQNHPSKWYNAVGMPYFSPAVLFDGAYTLPAGESLTLKYRIVIHPDVLSVDAAGQQWLAWTVEKKRLLILTGANNHAWQETSLALEEILESSGQFDVDIEIAPETLTSDTLSQYDVLLSNWNTYGGVTPTLWSESFKQAYLNFVRNGGGHVVVHAGSSSYYDWEMYQAMCLATWDMGQTKHASPHQFEVRFTDHRHPITQGLDPFTTIDELWYCPKVHSDATVIATAYSKTTGNWEPSAFVGQVGEGRCFTTLLGHSVSGLRRPGFQRLFLRGVEWVARLR